MSSTVITLGSKGEPLAIVGGNDNTMSLVLGAGITPISLDGSGNTTFSAMPAITTPSTITINATSGIAYGTTNTLTYNFSSAAVQGSDITFANSSALGSTFTVVNTGVYSVSFSFFASAQTGTAGIFVNDPTPTGLTLSAARALAGSGTAATEYRSASWVGRLSAGDVVTLRSLAASYLLTNVALTITRIA